MDSAFLALDPRSFGLGSSFLLLCDSLRALARATASCLRSARYPCLAVYCTIPLYVLDNCISRGRRWDNYSSGSTNLGPEALAPHATSRWFAAGRFRCFVFLDVNFTPPLSPDCIPIAWRVQISAAATAVARLAPEWAFGCDTLLLTKPEY